MDFEKYYNPIVEVDGVIENGKQFDLDIVLPEDNRNVIFGVIKDCYKEPVCNAVVKLIEVKDDCGKKVRKPVTHTFTNKDGEFVFGPLCPDKHYEVQVWVNRVKHVKLCAKCIHEGECLKGEQMDKCDVTIKCENKGKCDKKWDECDCCECCDCNDECEKDDKC